MGRMKIAWIVVVVVALMAVGAGSASATTTKLCKSNTSSCPANETYPAGSTFTVTGEFGISELTGCEYSYKFITGAASAVNTPLPTEITSFTFTGCAAGISVHALYLNWSFPIKVGSGGNGTGEMLGSISHPVIEVEGGGEVGCEYETPYIPQTIKGGGTISSSNVDMTNFHGSGCESSIFVSMGGTSKPKFFVTE